MSRLRRIPPTTACGKTSVLNRSGPLFEEDRDTADPSLPDPGKGPKIVLKSLLGVLGVLLGRSWSLLAPLGRLLASLCVSLAFRERFWNDFGGIFGAKIDDV